VVRNTEDKVSCTQFAARNLTIVFLTGLLAACGGSSGARNNPPPADPDDSDPPPSNPAPTLSLSASPTVVPAGGNATLTWQSEHADGCNASGGWTGTRGTGGSSSVGPIDADTVFRLSCSGAGGGVTREVTVRVADDNEVAVELDAARTQIGVNESTTLSWSSQGATRCTASGGWSGDRPLNGTFETGPLADSRTYSLTCTDGTENALASVTVDVFDKTIRWQAPEYNEDGTPVTDLAGYVIYWGEDSRAYTGSFRINSPSTTSWEADITPGTYYFAMTAFDSEGNESDYSNELLKIIP
tara:strand:- start:242 stop:1138 length:897 start_codon:yes stop_codon:yes gene_type:complete